MSKDLSARYYKRSKEKLFKKCRERYQNLSEEEKYARIWSRTI